MKPSEHELSFSFRARYYTLGQINQQTKKIWFVLHGYGQLAQFFIRKFESLEAAGIFVVAPEGLSTFYLEDVTKRSQGGNNKVGATWMTRENRIRDIHNYIAYLNSIFDHLVPRTFVGEICVLGFSQGAATAARWALDNHIRFNKLILWGGIFPPDMDFEKAATLLKEKQVMEIIGNQDPFLTDEKLNEMTSLHSRLKITPEVIRYEGGHEIISEVLQKLI